MTTCNRCQRDVRATIMSMFNQDTLCMECKRKEKDHPMYEAAVKAEHEALVSGDYNFPGIGRPSDL